MTITLTKKPATLHNDVVNAYDVTCECGMSRRILADKMEPRTRAHMMTMHSDLDPDDYEYIDAAPDNEYVASRIEKHIPEEEDVVADDISVGGEGFADTVGEEDLLD